MLGSPADADDAVQETMVRAWRAYERFDGRSSLRTWLYRIATNVCLDTIAERKRRALPMEEAGAGTIDDALIERPRTHWVEPVPDAHVLPTDVDPEERTVLKQSIRLAFVAALQHLPPKQRAALLLAEVLGWSAAEIAASLDTSVASVNSALQRARATLQGRGVGLGAAPVATSLPDDDELLLERYVDAFERYDVDRLASLLREDAVFSMPPYALWLRGPAAVRGWLLGRGSVCRNSRLLRTAACGMPAFAHYHLAPGGGYEPWGLVVLDLDGDRIAGWHSFLDAASLFPRFGFPLHLDA